MRSLSEPPSYDELRYEWRKKLSDAHVRELTADFLRGHVDDCCYDAYLEYVERFGPVSSRHPYATKEMLAHIRSMQP